MNKFVRQKHSFDIIFILFVFLLLSISAMLVVIFGSYIYTSSVKTQNQTNSYRIADSFFRQKIKNTNFDNIELKNINGYETLLIYETINSVSYTTYLYEYENSLYELLSRSDTEFDAESGTSIFAISDLSFTWIKNNLLNISFSEPDSLVNSIYISLPTDNYGGY